MKIEKASNEVENELLSYADAARFLGMAKGTLYSLVHDKRIPHVRLGARLVRFSRAALGAWLEEKTVPCK